MWATEFSQARSRKKARARRATVAVPVGLTAPYAQYIDDSVGFGREVLGMDPWSARLDAALPVRVAGGRAAPSEASPASRDKSGQKTGKSSLGGDGALVDNSRVQGTSR